MRKLSHVALVLSFAILPGTPASAASKVWVSTSGTDNGTCGAVTAPCRTFQIAHNNVAAGGEIGVLTPGDYAVSTSSGLAINKSVNVTNDGTGEATIVVPNTGSVGIFATAGAGDIVSLRGLVIDGQIAGGVGIEYTLGAAVHVQNCVIRNFEANSQGEGIYFSPPGTSQLFVSDTIIFNNGSTASTGGIVIRAQGGSANVVLDRVHLENNVDGLLLDSATFGSSGAPGIHATVRDSVMSGNAANGIHAVTAAGKPAAFAFVTRSTMVNNAQNGILANGPGATLLLNESTVARNGTGISTINGGQLISYRNNQINNNIGPDGTPTGFFALN